MKHCPVCQYQWDSKVPRPKACPKCKARLDAGPPTRMVIPLAKLADEKKRNVMALNKFEESAERSHAHGVVLGRIELIEWLESEVSAAKRRSA